jgi:hypothetical protein
VFFYVVDVCTSPIQIWQTLFNEVANSSEPHPKIDLKQHLALRAEGRFSGSPRKHVRSGFTTRVAGRSRNRAGDVDLRNSRLGLCDPIEFP